MIVTFSVICTGYYSQHVDADLEAALKEREAGTDTSAAEPAVAETDDVISAMHKFMVHSSDFEGIESINVDSARFCDTDEETDSDDDVTGRIHETTAPAKRSSCKVVINPDRFMEILSGEYGTSRTERVASIPHKDTRMPASAPLFTTGTATRQVDVDEGELSDMMDSSGEDSEDDNEANVQDYMVGAQLHVRPLTWLFALCTV